MDEPVAGLDRRTFLQALASGALVAWEFTSINPGGPPSARPTPSPPPLVPGHAEARPCYPPGKP
jgi:hypothetical protein